MSVEEEIAFCMPGEDYEKLLAELDGGKKLEEGQMILKYWASNWYNNGATTSVEFAVKKNGYIIHLIARGPTKKIFETYPKFTYDLSHFKYETNILK
jgi:hypothetical protein